MTPGSITSDLNYVSFTYGLDPLFEETFGRTLNDWPNDHDLNCSVPVDLYQMEDCLVISVNLPGVRRENLKISVETNRLQLEGEFPFDEESRCGKAYLRERRWGKFSRMIALPGNVDPAHIATSYRDGVLKVIVPKR